LHLLYVCVVHHFISVFSCFLSVRQMEVLHPVISTAGDFLFSLLMVTALDSLPPDILIFFVARELSSLHYLP
jgi:hypothetical protein